MSNVCKVEEIKQSKIGDISQLKTTEQPTFKDILAELNKLELENKCLKADKQELQKEVIQLRNDNIELHNKLNVEESDDPSMLNKYEGEYLCGCETEEDLKAMQQAYAEFV